MRIPKIIRPQARAPAAAEEKAARQAMFENGSSLIKVHAHKVQSGYPGGICTPA